MMMTTVRGVRRNLIPILLRVVLCICSIWKVHSFALWVGSTNAVGCSSLSSRKSSTTTTTTTSAVKLVANSNNINVDVDDDDNDGFESGFKNDYNSINDDEQLMNSLAQRIQQLQELSTQQEVRERQELSRRMRKLQESEGVQAVLEGQPITSSLEEEEDRIPNNRRVVTLPVVCFDALLPKQEMEGRTDDPLFCEFLRDQVGLGGWFVMTSLNFFTRTIRRHGTIIKVIGMDAINTEENGNTMDTKRSSIPTAVDFFLVGHSRCRVIGPNVGMKQRIGRWRRAYDPNGEVMMLGWGEERFTDAAEDLSAMISIDELESEDIDSKRQSRNNWSNCWIEVNLEDVERMNQYEQTTEVVTSLQQTLPGLVDEWFSLASNVATYENTNVTASTRIQKGAPGLWVDPHKLLQRVSNQLGPIPSIQDDPTAFCFWVAALINPLPALGVSLEIRGKLLEAATIEKRLQIVENGLRRSIDNLTGMRPL